MPQAELRIVVWNVRWQRASSRAGAEIRARIADCAPDIAVITEGHPDFLDLPHRLHPLAGHGYARTDGGRKVLLWSCAPWHAAELTGDPDLPPGRYVAGRTATPAGDVVVHGVCIPWSAAHVRTGRRDRAMWQDHLAYLEALGRILRRAPSPAATLVAGDFNQAMPRRRAPRHVYDALMGALPPWLHCATAGAIPDLAGPVIDHVCHTADVAVVELRGLPRQGVAGRALSDHDGLFLRLAPAR